MAAAALDHDLERAGARHDRPAAGGEDAGLSRQHVDPVGSLDARSRRVEHALADHPQRPAPGLLARLEHQHDRAPQLLPACGQQPGRADEARRVQVVPARVHHPVDARGIGESGALLHPEGVHIGAQQHGGAGAVAVHDGGDRGEVLGARCHLEAEPVEGVEHGALRPGEGEARLGVSVQCASQSDELGQERFGVSAECGRIRHEDSFVPGRRSVPADAHWIC